MNTGQPIPVITNMIDGEHSVYVKEPKKKLK